MSPTPAITIAPDPPLAGQEATICYTGSLPATLELDFVPASQPPTIALPAPGGCAKLTLPPTAISICIHDPSGAAPDLNRATV